MTSTQYANSKLNALAKFCHQNRGAVSRLHRRLVTRTGQSINRRNLDRWLHAEPGMRVEPALGVSTSVPVAPSRARWCGSPRLVKSL